jgi:hypothetical protein
MIRSPAEWIERCEAVLAAGGLNERERDFVVGIRHRKAWGAEKRRRPKFVLTPDQYAMFAELEGRVVRKEEREDVGE